MLLYVNSLLLTHWHTLDFWISCRLIITSTNYSDIELKAYEIWFGIQYSANIYHPQQFLLNIWCHILISIYLEYLNILDFCPTSDVMFFGVHIVHVIFEYLVLCCVLHIFWMASPQGRLWRSGRRGRWINSHACCETWPLFAFVFLSYFLLPCCLSSVIFSTASIFSTKLGSPGLQELLMPDHLFFSHWCYQANKASSSAQSWRERRAGGGRQRHRQRQRRRQHRPLAAPGSLGVLSPSEWQCGPQVWRPSWAMVAVPPPPWAPPAACSRGCSRATLAHQTIPTTP